MLLSTIDLAGVPPLWSLAAKATAMLVFAVSALALLRSAHLDRQPASAARRAARRSAYVSPFARPLPPQPAAPRLQAGRERDRLASVLDQASHRVEAVHASTVTAAREIDGAEIALNRLLVEISGVMPSVIAPTIVPRRQLSASISARHAAAA